MSDSEQGPGINGRGPHAALADPRLVKGARLRRLVVVTRRQAERLTPDLEALCASLLDSASRRTRPDAGTGAKAQTPSADRGRAPQREAHLHRPRPDAAAGARGT